MKIANIESFLVHQSLDTPFSFSQWEYASRSICMVRITTNNGAYGWGEGYGPAPVVKAGVDWLAPFIVGQNALQTGVLWQTLYRHSLDYARSGALMASLSAIDVALWDLKGKLLNQPVHTLLGGQRRDRVKVYATGMYFTPGYNLAARLADEAQGYVSQGYQALKMKVGHSLGQDIENVQAVRQAIGPTPALMVDANHAYSLAEASELARAIEPCRIAWFEEPLSPEDYAGYAELRQGTSIPIAAGECEYLTHGFRRLLEARCVDVAQPDLCATGGLTEGQRIAALARAHYVPIAPHCWGSGIGFAVGLHFVAALDTLPGRLIPAEPILEMDRTENPLRDSLTQPRFQATDGYVSVPQSPGLGIDLDPDLLNQYRSS